MAEKKKNCYFHLVDNEYYYKLVSGEDEKEFSWLSNVIVLEKVLSSSMICCRHVFVFF